MTDPHNLPKSVAATIIPIAAFSLLLALPLSSFAAVRQVGPGKTYARPCLAIAAAQSGDIIEIDAGTYANDACTVGASNLIIRGVGTGRAVMNWTSGDIPNGKAIFVTTGNNTTIENIEFAGARVSSENGAGIRTEGSGLTIRNCYFHNNQNGILGSGAFSGDLLVEFSEFANNGTGDGLTHNIYINNATKFTFQYNYSHHASVGHTLKTRAPVNYILYNRIMDEASGTASYTIDVPNGGLTYVIGNLLQQGPATDNPSILAYAAEGGSNPIQELYVINNTFVNDLSSGGTFLRVNGSPAVSKIQNNIFFGPGTVLSGAGTQTTNLSGTDPRLVNRGAYDYHLLSNSTAIDAGSDPGTARSFSLTPVFQYVHPSQREARVTSGARIDIGAYEFGGTAPADTKPPSAPKGLRLP